jgi:hypothetical protein
MAKGFDMGVVVQLDYIESLATFFTHPSHDEFVESPSLATAREKRVLICI